MEKLGPEKNNGTVPKKNRAQEKLGRKGMIVHVKK